MSNKTLYIIWGILYALCAGMGLIPAPTGAQYGALVTLSLFFFLPGAVLLYRAVRKNDIPALKRIRLLSICSLGLTTVMVIVNFLSFDASEAAGMAVYILLAIVSAPMLCAEKPIICTLCICRCLSILARQYTCV